MLRMFSAARHSTFQFTPPRGGRRKCPTRCDCSGLYFNSRPRVGGDESALKRSSAVIRFQFTPPRGGRLPHREIRAVAVNFNSRPRVGGDVNAVACAVVPVIFQFTPPRGGRLMQSCTIRSISRISIHAPAWGATRSCATKLAPPNFNSRPRVGGDPLAHILRRQTAISIHAPAWGATKIRLKFSAISTFQFTPPRGGRQQKRTKRCCNDCAFCCISRLVSRKRESRGSFLFGLCSESPLKRCADLPKKCVRRRSARQRFTEAAAHRFRSVRCVR